MEEYIRTQRDRIVGMVGWLADDSIHTELRIHGEPINGFVDLFDIAELWGDADELDLLEAEFKSERCRRIFRLIQRWMLRQYCEAERTSGTWMCWAERENPPSWRRFVALT